MGEVTAPPETLNAVLMSAQIVNEVPPVSMKREEDRTKWTQKMNASHVVFPKRKRSQEDRSSSPNEIKTHGGD